MGGRVDCEAQEQPWRTPSPSAPTSPTACSQYWVKDKNSPVNVAPPGCFHESYAFLRSKALNQRRLSVSGGCSHDMSVLYQFWSHFLVRNFNTRMYDEFCLFALEDSRKKLSDVGISNLIKFYGESVLSNQDVVRENVVRDFIDLIRSEKEPWRPAFDQLRSALHNDNMNARNRTRINELLDDELKASLD
jgi:la-related protein 1